MLNHPPKPRLTLRVGIAGHRPKPHRFPSAAVARVERQLREVFAAIDEALHAMHAENQNIYAEKAPQVRLVSGMAEGADQLAVSARPEKWHVDAILPFPLANYMQDFQTSASGSRRDVRPEFQRALAQAQTVTELPEETGAREAAYARLGALLLRQIDLLIAVWDGGPAEGAGSTTDVVKKALEVGISVVWLSSSEGADNLHNVAYPRIIDDIKENGEPIAPDADCTRGYLQEVVSSIVSGPAPGLLVNSGDERDARERLIDFLGETWPRRTWWSVYDMFKRLTEHKPIRPLVLFEPRQDCGHDWDQFVSEAPPAGSLADRIIKVLKPRYLWADTLAVYLANVYRSAYMVLYLLSAFAVAVGLCGLFSHQFETPYAGLNASDAALNFKGAIVIVELLIIFLIICIVRAGRQGSWHQKFLEYRALAEMLRHVRFLAYLGENGRILRAEVTPASAWFLWYLRATVREIGLPNAVLDGTYQRAHLAAVEKNTIAVQIEYHTRNAATLERMHRAIQRVGDGCFYSAGAVLLAWGLGWLAVRGGAQFKVWPDFLNGLRSFLEVTMEWVTYFAAWLPALGAALAGIRETADFEGAATASVKTLAALETLKADYAEAKRTLLLAETGDVSVATAHVLTEDLATWQAIYGRKRLTLPA
jgi:hypothetical protein